MSEDVSRQVKRFEVTKQAAADLFKESTQITDGVPEDARVQAMYPDPERETLWLIIQSQSYDAVPEGTEIPIEEITAEHRDPMEV